MLDDKELLCSFIYSSYSKGSCGLTLPIEIVNKNKKACLDYLAKRIEFPINVLRYHQNLVSAIKRFGIRGYIYGTHLDKVIDDVKDLFWPYESNNIFRDESKKLANPIIKSYILDCIISLWLVNGIGSDYIIGENLIEQTITKRLEMIAENLNKESIVLGGVVSAHWGYVLEDVTSELNKPYIKRYIKKLKRLYSEL